MNEKEYLFIGYDESGEELIKIDKNGEFYLKGELIDDYKQKYNLLINQLSVL